MNEDLFCEDNLKTLRFEGFFFLIQGAMLKLKKKVTTHRHGFTIDKRIQKKNQWDSLLYAVRDRDC